MKLTKPKTKIYWIICIFILTGLLVGCNVAPAALPATSQAISLSDGLGRVITLASPAQRVVSLAPANTEILFAIGAGKQVVGRDTFSDFPAEVQEIPDIGGGFGELNIEIIVSLEPDLILASALSPPEQIKALEELKLNVFQLGNPNDIEGMYDNLRAVAQLTGHEQEVEALIQTLTTRVADLDQKLASVSARPLVFYEIDGTDPNAPWTAGPGSFVGRLINRAGGNNLGDSLQGEWVQISLEELIARDPDLILIGDAIWGGVTPEAVASRSGWDTLTAVKVGRLYPFDDNLVSRPGPRLVDGLEALARLLHPELFQ